MRAGRPRPQEYILAIVKVALGYRAWNRGNIFPHLRQEPHSAGEQEEERKDRQAAGRQYSSNAHQRRPDNRGEFADHVIESEIFAAFFSWDESREIRATERLDTALDESNDHSEGEELGRVGELGRKNTHAGINDNPNHDTALRPDLFTEPSIRNCGWKGDKLHHEEGLDNGGAVQADAQSKICRHLDHCIYAVDIEDVGQEEEQQAAV